MPKTSPPASVAEYIAHFPQPVQGMMRQLRSIIRTTVPRARETISYRMPFYEYRSPGYRGRLVYFGGFRTHVSIFIVPRKIPARVAKKMRPYQSGRATLRFALGTKIPVALLRQLLTIRRKEIDQLIDG